MVTVVEQLLKQVFRVKKLVGLPPQLKLLAVVFHKSGHDNMSNNATTCKKYEHTQFHSGMDTQTHCALIFLLLNPSSFRVVPNNLASHAHDLLPSHIVFLHFKT